MRNFHLILKKKKHLISSYPEHSDGRLHVPCIFSDVCEILCTFVSHQISLLVKMCESLLPLPQKKNHQATSTPGNKKEKKLRMWFVSLWPVFVKI